MSMLAWAFMIAAGVLEPTWVICLEKSKNFKRLGWAAACVIAAILCTFFLTLAAADLGAGIAYALLAGFGSIGTVLAGYALYKEPITAKKVICVLVILAGAASVHLVGGA